MSTACSKVKWSTKQRNDDFLNLGILKLFSKQTGTEKGHWRRCLVIKLVMQLCGSYLDRYVVMLCSYVFSNLVSYVDAIVKETIQQISTAQKTKLMPGLFEWFGPLQLYTI